MPITPTGQGEGRYSALKQEHFKVFAGTHNAITYGALRKGKRWAHPNPFYIDLNAGTGYCGVVDGSPIAFLKTAKKNCNAYFVEVRQDAAKVLRSNIEEFSQHNCKVICEDNRKALIDITKDIKEICSASTGYVKRPMGLMYSDENGTRAPFTEIAWSLRQPHMQMIDVLFYVSGAAFKRVMKSMPEKGYLRIEEYVSLMPKKYWQIRQPAGCHQWCFLFGSNWCEYPALTNQGFFSVNSNEGMKIMEIVSNTTEERMERELERASYKQQNLFDLDLYSA